MSKECEVIAHVTNSADVFCMACGWLSLAAVFIFGAVVIWRLPK